MLRVAVTILVGALLGAVMGSLGSCSTGACPLTSTWWRGAIYGGAMGLLLAMAGR